MNYELTLWQLHSRRLYYRHSAEHSTSSDIAKPTENIRLNEFAMFFKHFHTESHRQMNKCKRYSTYWSTNNYNRNEMYLFQISANTAFRFAVPYLHIEFGEVHKFGDRRFNRLLTDDFARGMHRWLPNRLHNSSHYLVAAAAVARATMTARHQTGQEERFCVLMRRTYQYHHRPFANSLTHSAAVFRWLAHMKRLIDLKKFAKCTCDQTNRIWL